MEKYAKMQVMNAARMKETAEILESEANKMGEEIRQEIMKYTGLESNDAALLNEIKSAIYAIVFKYCNKLKIPLNFDVQIVWNDDIKQHQVIIGIAE